MNQSLPPIPILMYHEVWESTEGRIRHTNPAYVLTARNFSRQMHYLHDSGHRTLCLDEYLDGSRENEPQSVIITFDDGWYNNYSQAFPVLNELGLKATIFVVTDFIGQKGYMDWPQLKEMQENGISIQSHTASHGPLTEKSEVEIGEELRASKNKIEDRLGKLVQFMSAPHGMIDKRVIDAAMAAGYRAICTSEPGFRHSPGCPAILRRINISEKGALLIYQRICEKNEFAILPMVLSKQLKRVLKRMLGYTFYRKMYQMRYRISK